MNTRTILRSLGIVLLVFTFGSASWSQEKPGLPEFFGFYALDGGQSIAIYEGQGSESGKRTRIEWYSIPQNSKQQDTTPQLSTSARFVLFYSNSGEMIQSMSLYKLPYVRNIIETQPAFGFSPPSRRIVDSPNMPLLAGIPDLSFKLLAKPVSNQPQMVELVPSPQLTPGTYVAQYSPSGANGWFAIFSVGATSEAENRFCLDLVLPGGPRGLFERANSELNSTVPLLAPYRYTRCDSSASSGAPAIGSSATPSGNTSAIGAATWTDTETGLMWTGSDNNADLIFDQAVGYCKSLKLGGFSDWRLPEIDELKGISDRSYNVPVNRPDLVALHIPGVPGFAHIKGYISISGLEISNTGKPPAELETFDFGLGKVKLIKSNKRHPFMRALCVRNASVAASIPKPISRAPAAPKSPCDQASATPYSILANGHLYKVRVLGPSGPQERLFFFDEKGTQVTDLNLVTQLATAVWTHDNVVSSPDARSGSTRVSGILGTSKALQNYDNVQDLLARSMVEAIEAVATEGSTLTKAVPNITLGALKRQLLTAPKTILTLTAQRGLEESLAKYRQLDTLLPPQDASALDATDLARIRGIYLQARTLELPYEALAVKLMPTQASELTAAALKSAMSELTNGPLFSGAPTSAVTLQRLLELEKSLMDLAKSLPAFQEYAQNLRLALNLTKANGDTISKWADGATQQCGATQASHSSAETHTVKTAADHQHMLLLTGPQNAAIRAFLRTHSYLEVVNCSTPGADKAWCKISYQSWEATVRGQGAQPQYQFASGTSRISLH